MFVLLSRIDISEKHNTEVFQAWKDNDGTIDGLRKFYEAQQSVRTDPPSALVSAADSTNTAGG